MSLAVPSHTPRLDKGGLVENVPLSSGSAEALIGVARVSFRWLHIAVVDPNLLQTVIVTFVRVAFVGFLLSGVCLCLSYLSLLSLHPSVDICLSLLSFLSLHPRFTCPYTPALTFALHSLVWMSFHPCIDMFLHSLAWI